MINYLLKIFFFATLFFHHSISFAYALGLKTVPPTQKLGTQITSPNPSETFDNQENITITADAWGIGTLTENTDFEVKNIGSKSADFIKYVAFYANGIELGRDYTSPFSYEWENVNIIGDVRLQTKAVDIYKNISFSQKIDIFIENTLPQSENKLGIEIKYPFNQSYTIQEDSLPIEADVFLQNPPEPPYFSITTNEKLWKGVKIGYNHYNVWTPPINATENGNSVLIIELKKLGGNPQLNKINLRAQGSSNKYVELVNYTNNIDDWTTLEIPLSDFCTCDVFQEISFLELRSEGSEPFSIGVRLIKLSGGSQDFEWLGGNIINNATETEGDNNIDLAIIGDANYFTEEVLFYANNQLIGSDNTPPYSILWENVPTGTHNIYAQVNDTDNFISTSENIMVFSDEGVGDIVEIEVSFEDEPNFFNIKKAPFKYNKKFAYSLTLDDGDEDIYSFGRPLFEGGTITANGQNIESSGLFYTDGCGNDIPFKAGVAWYSYDSSFEDIHDDETAGFMTWQNLTHLYRLGWDVYNHSLSHQTTGVDFDFQVAENNAVVLNKTGIEMTHFVVPAGETDYVQPALNFGMQAVYNQTGTDLGFVGLNGQLEVSNDLSLNNFKLLRNFKSIANSDFDNITTEIDEIADMANQNPFWYNDFTHGIYETGGGGMYYELFDFYMRHIADTYGKNGSDMVWMASLQEVFEYLKVEQNTMVQYEQNGNLVRVLLDVSDVPKNLRRNALSLVIDTEQNIKSISIDGVSDYNFNPETGLININWGWNPNVLKNTSSFTKNTVKSNLNIYPNPTNDLLFISLNNNIDLLHKTVQLQVMDVSGRVIIDKKMVSISPNFLTKLDVSDLVGGVYMLRVVGLGGGGEMMILGGAKFLKN